MQKNTKNKPTLAFHPASNTPSHFLPFAGRDHTEDKSFSFWDIPAEGGYTGGILTGGAIGQIYLKYLRDTVDADNPLGDIVESWRKRLAHETGTQRRSPAELALMGQMDGFLHVIAPYLAAGVRRNGDALNRVTCDELLAAANEGISLDEIAFASELESRTGTVPQ